MALPDPVSLLKVVDTRSGCTFHSDSMDKVLILSSPFFCFFLPSSCTDSPTLQAGNGSASATHRCTHQVGRTFHIDTLDKVLVLLASFSVFPFHLFALTHPPCKLLWFGHSKSETYPSETSTSCQHPAPGAGH